MKVTCKYCEKVIKPIVKDSTGLKATGPDMTIYCQRCAGIKTLEDQKK